eukprot:1258669-Alexandrium_andersonii.AAC.1
MIAEQASAEAARGELTKQVSELQKRLASVVSQKSSSEELEKQVLDVSAENAALREQFMTAIDDLNEWQEWYEENKEWVDGGPPEEVPEEDLDEEEFQDPEEA